MALSAIDLKNDDTGDAGIDLIVDGITSPVTGDVGVTRIDVGTGTTAIRMDSSNPLFAQLTAGTAEVGKLAAGTAEIGNVKNAGTFVVQIDGTALTRLTDIETNTNYGATTGGGTESGALRVTVANDSTGVLSVDDNGVSLTVDNAGLTELAAAINSNKMDIDIASSTVDVMLGSDFTGVLGTVDITLSDQADNVDNDSNTIKVTAFTYVFDGTAWDRLRGNSTDGALVNLGSNNNVVVTNVGAFATQVDGDALTALQLIDNVVVTEDAAAAANPDGNMMMSVRDDEVGSTAITTDDNDVQALRSDRFGALKVTQLPDATSEIKFFLINAASGDTELVAAAGVGIKIRVLNVVCIAGGTTDCRFESAAGGTALTGVMKLVVNSGFAPGYCPTGHFETADNAALSLETTGDVDGWGSYVEV